MPLLSPFRRHLFYTTLGMASQLKVVNSKADAEVSVRDTLGGGWIISNELVEQVAIVPAGDYEALRAGLEHYYRYNVVLRLARKSQAPELLNKVDIRVLDCNDTELVASAKTSSDPSLPEATKNPEGDYALAEGFKFCIRLTNSY